MIMEAGCGEDYSAPKASLDPFFRLVNNPG